MPIVAGKRQVGLAGWIQLREQSLINGDVTAAKSMPGPGKVKAPDPVGRFFDKGKRLGMVCFQAGEPMAQCKHIMFAKIFDVANLETGRFRCAKHNGQRRNIAVGKNVMLDE